MSAEQRMMDNLTGFTITGQIRIAFMETLEEETPLPLFHEGNDWEW
jgi:hypothetical protein